MSGWTIFSNSSGDSGGVKSRGLGLGGVGSRGGFSVVSGGGLGDGLVAYEVVVFSLVVSSDDCLVSIGVSFPWSLCSGLTTADRCIMVPPKLSSSELSSISVGESGGDGIISLSTAVSYSDLSLGSTFVTLIRPNGVSFGKTLLRSGMFLLTLIGLYP